MRTVQGALTAVAGLVVAACATGPTASPAVDVAGKWQGTWAFVPTHLGNGTVTANLKQDGSKVTGDLDVAGPARTRPLHFIGQVSGDDVRMIGPDVTGWLKVK